MTTERPSLEAAVVIVGAGPAGLACGLRLAQLLDEHREREPRLPAKDSIFILEKGRETGAHLLSGAVLDPSALDRLLPGWRERAPIEAAVADDAAFFLTSRRALRFPITPPPLRNHGNYVVSLNRLGKWLGEQVEAAGLTIFTATAGARLLFGERHAVIGVRTDDKGVDRRGERKANFEPGYDLKTPLVVLAEGPRGSLTKQLLGRLGLAGPNPQLYALGVKEIWSVPAGRMPPGRVWHTMGWPVPRSMYGGGWIYGLAGHRVSLGLVTGLEYHDPGADPHVLFQRFKTHPFVRRILAGGEMIRYGAKTVPMGGYYSQPPAAGAGWMLIGDAAGLVNSQRLKGIHLAIHSGMLAAEAIFDSWRTGDPAAVARTYPERVAAGAIRRELWTVRNFHQGFERGLFAGLLNGAAQMLTGGRGWRDPMLARAGHLRMQKLQAAPRHDWSLQPDEQLTFSKITDVYHSGTRHEEDQPPHLIIHDTDICNTRCIVEYGNPCQHFCPAQVYEMLPAEDGTKRIHVNASNCVHCKTCDIQDPYEIITWVPPEGGGGPNYEGM
ncbi:MAG TPA: electron transfer flavoprotein-ubiquinone oxidoreductase [Terriglobales bacterium]|nr:electron transfer flavoprotein-ubiquinone oxidoreductase [Terriglobales bacterium]